MLPTPTTSHLNFDQIYEPSEDSYLFLDALSAPAECQWLSARLRNAPTPLVCEVGTGSGVILSFLAANALTILGRNDALTLGIDVSIAACKGAEVTVRRNAPKAQFLGCVQGDLTTALRPGEVDVLLFNPPYVPSEAVPATGFRDAAADGSASSALPLTSIQRFEHDSHLLAQATDGGADGMEVTNRLLAQIPEVLSERGVAYVLLCAQNRPEVVKEGVRAWGKGSGRLWVCETVRTSGKMGGWEKLCIVRIARVMDE